jgi:type II secretory pathway pseudopilin PulG
MRSGLHPGVPRVVNNHPNTRPGAFTLIELLVVVAITALLIAIIVPALAEARALAKRMSCQGNLRQIAIAYGMYLDDSGGWFYGQGSFVRNPNYTFGGWRGKHSRIPNRPINGYLGLPVRDASQEEAVVFKCPADRYPDPNETLFGSFYADTGNSYQANGILVDPCSLPFGIREPWGTINQSIRAFRFARRDSVCQPSRLLWIADFAWYAQWDPLNSICTGSHSRRHRYCAVFLDGHTAFVEIFRGLYDVEGGYRMQPHGSADPVVHQLQQREPCSCEQRNAD